MVFIYGHTPVAWYRFSGLDPAPMGDSPHRPLRTARRYRPAPRLKRGVTVAEAAGDTAAILDDFGDRQSSTWAVQEAVLMLSACDGAVAERAWRTAASYRTALIGG